MIYKILIHLRPFDSRMSIISAVPKTRNYTTLPLLLCKHIHLIITFFYLKPGLLWTHFSYACKYDAEDSLAVRASFSDTFK